MISNVVVFLTLLCGPSSAVPINISVFKNIVFLPNSLLYQIASLSPIEPSNACLCRCYNISVCCTVTYIGANRTCLLYFAQLDYGQPQSVPANMNASVYSFASRGLCVVVFQPSVTWSLLRIPTCGNRFREACE